MNSSITSKLLIISIIFSIICLILISYIYFNYDIEFYEQFKLLIVIFISTSLTFLYIKKIVEENMNKKNDAVKEMFDELKDTNYNNNSLNEKIEIEKNIK